MPAFEQRLKDVVRKAMDSQGVSQSMLVQRWHRDPAYLYEKREVVRNAVWRLLHPHYEVSLSHFEFALKLLNCEAQLSLVPRSNNVKGNGNRG